LRILWRFRGDVKDPSRHLLQGQFKDKAIEIRRVEVVGPKVGKDLKTKAIWAMGLAFLGY